MYEAVQSILFHMFYILTLKEALRVKGHSSGLNLGGTNEKAALAASSSTLRGPILSGQRSHCGVRRLTVTQVEQN